MEYGSCRQSMSCFRKIQLSFHLQLVLCSQVHALFDGPWLIESAGSVHSIGAGRDLNEI
ncbi:hypothetical protein ES702_05512 [subsurface metagenome]